MPLLMDLIAGSGKEILLAIAIDDWAALDDRQRFDGHVSMGGAMDPTWLDLFSQAARDATGRDEPVDFLEARREVDGPTDVGERTIERIDPAWITAVARIGDHELDAVTGRWIELLEQELGPLPREEKPWIRQLSGEIVTFARRADHSPTVLLAWAL